MVACGAPTEAPKKEEKKAAPTPVVPTLLHSLRKPADGYWLYFRTF